VFETRIAETISIVKANENKKKKKDDDEDEEDGEDQKIRIDPKFRIWATTKPDADFPTFIAMNSIKIVCETSQSIKSHMIKNYNLIEKNYFTELDEERMLNLKKLMYGTVLMHTAFYHRSQYNPLGFNKDYKFSNSDFECSKELLKIFVTNSSEAPIVMYQTVLSEIIYGGKMSDYRDEILTSELVGD
jgi:dynein heavy chain